MGAPTVTDLLSSPASIPPRQAVAEALRDVLHYFERYGRQTAAETIRTLLGQLAEDRFNLVVVGQFKRGKSTLINALLGCEILPTAVVPLTSVITVLQYGPSERVLVYPEDSPAGVSVEVSALADYVTERGNPANVRRIRSVGVEVPSPVLRHGLRIIDTPGIGSATSANTATTYTFLSDVDAVIFVTSVESPLTEPELTFLDVLRQSIDRIFFILNKVDQAGGDERQEVIRYVEHLLRERVGASAVRLFPVSAREGLAGKRQGDLKRVTQSGLAEFEAALEQFLREEREATHLQGILDRAHRVLTEELYFLARLQPPDQADGSRNLPDQAWSAAYLDTLEATCDRLFQHLEEQRAALLAAVVAPAAAAFAQEEQAILSGQIDDLLAQHRSLEAAAAYQQIREQLQRSLREHQRTWLTEHTSEWTEAAAQLLAEARRAFNVDSHAEADHDPTWPLQAHLPIQPPPFFPQQGRRGALLAGPVGESLYLLLPRRFADRFLRRRLLADLAQEIEQIQSDTREEINHYLTGTIHLIRQEIGRALQDLRQLAALDHTSRDDSQLDKSAEDPRRRMQEATILADRLAALRTARDTTIPSEAVGQGTADVTAERTGAGITIEGDIAATSVAAALGGDQCPLCAAVQAATWEYLCHWQYTLATDAAAREILRADGGFCPRHTWALEAIASPRGLCMAYPPLLDTLAREIRGITRLDPPAMRQRLGALLAAPERCRLCRFERERTAAARQEFLALLRTLEGRTSYLRSPGLCLPHLYSVVTDSTEDDVISFLLKTASQRLHAAAEDMRSYVLKVEARRRDLLTPSEEHVSRRVPALLAGTREIGGGPWR
jgi:small GTP-binding protein